MKIIQNFFVKKSKKFVSRLPWGVMYMKAAKEKVLRSLHKERKELVFYKDASKVDCFQLVFWGYAGCSRFIVCALFFFAYSDYILSLFNNKIPGFTILIRLFPSITNPLCDESNDLDLC